MDFHILFFSSIQLVRLLEMLEMHMICEVRKRVSKELTLTLSERAREETALPTDLWKRAVSILLCKYKSNQSFTQWSVDTPEPI